MCKDTIRPRYESVENRTSGNLLLNKIGTVNDVYRFNLNIKQKPKYTAITILNCHACNTRVGTMCNVCHIPLHSIFHQLIQFYALTEFERTAISVLYIYSNLKCDTIENGAAKLL